MSGPIPRRAVALVAAVNAAFMAGLAVWAEAGWPGRPNSLLLGNGFYCEALRAGWIKQPANTWSNLGFVVVGLWLAGRAKSWRAAALALFVSLLGPGSMALHASMTMVGGMIDVSSMFLFIGCLAAHNASRLSDAVDENFGAFLAATSAAMIALAVLGDEHGPALFGALIGVFLLAEGLVAAGRRGAGRDRRLLAAAFGFFGLAFLIWIFSVRTTDALCSPDSWLQGHAAWHLLSALAAGSLYLYVEPELAAPAAAE